MLAQKLQKRKKYLVVAETLVWRMYERPKGEKYKMLLNVC